MTGFFDALWESLVTTSPGCDASFVSAVSEEAPTPPSLSSAAENEPSSSVVLCFLRDKTRLFEVVPDLEDRISGTHTLLKGFVQSGKSRLAHALLLYLTMERGHNVCMLLRDYTGDYTQFRYLGGLEPFLEEMVAYGKGGAWSEEDEDVPPIYYLGDVGMNIEGVLTRHHSLCEALAEGGTIVIGLANTHQVGKMNAVWDLVVADGNDMTLSVVIDECDQLMYSEGDAFSPQLDRLLEKANGGGIYGISATVMENLHDERFSTADVYVMTPSSDYRGIGNWVEPVPIESIDEGIKKQKPLAFLEWDTGLCAFLDRDHPVYDIHTGKKHPTVVLIKTERWVRHQDALLEAIVRDDRFGPKYTVIVYNGDDTKLYAPSLVGADKICLPLCGKKESAKKSTADFHVFSKCAIQYVLQYLKNNGGAEVFPRILIIAHGLVGRGVNIVSADYGWHLTDMFYRPAQGISIATLLQSIRLCGVYRDRIRLRLYMESSYIEEMLRGHGLEMDILGRLGAVTSSSEENDSIRSWLGGQHFLEDKIPRAKVTKRGRFAGIRTRNPEEDEGVSMEEFLRDRCLAVAAPAPSTTTTTTTTMEAHVKDMDTEEFRHLVKMFAKWGSTGSTSKIAQFMHNLDDKKRYTEVEIKALCKEYGVSLSHLTKKHDPHGWAFGNILVRVKDTYRLHPQLLREFKKNF